jgi:hypothetical protein
MTKFLMGFVAGLIVATVGFSGVARMLDNGVSRVQDVSREISQ